MPVNMDKLVSLDRAKEIKTAENGMIATVEASSTASKAYAVGDYFYYTGKLYKASAAIASGGTITVGTNCALAKLGDDVGALKSAFSEEFEPITITQETGLINSNNQPVSGDSFRHTVVSVSENQVFKITGYKYSSSFPAWIFRKDGVIKSMDTSLENGAFSDLSVTIPNDVNELIVNGNSTYPCVVKAPTMVVKKSSLPSDTVYQAGLDTVEDGIKSISLISKDAIASDTDLNTIRTPGVYRLRGTYTNAPDISDTRYGASGTIVGNLLVLNPNSSGTGESIVQILTIGAPYAIYFRTWTSASWYRWSSFAGNAYSWLEDGTDLNSVKDSGIYYLDTPTRTYTHYPFAKEISSVLVVMRQMNDTEAVLQILYPRAHSIAPLYRHSVYGNDVWVAFGKNNDTSIKVGYYNHPNYTPLTYNPRTAIKLKVGTINIGHFNYGDSSQFGIQTDEYDMKLHNWREYFCKQQFDFVNLNEYVPYIDPLASSAALEGTKLTTTYVLKPQFQYFDSTMDTDRKGAVIASKYPISNETEFSLAGTTNNGYGRYYNVTIDENHVIGVYAIQMVFLSAPGDTYDSAASIANRKAQMDSLATIIGNHSDNYIVVMGDMNTGTSTDHTNVANFCSDNGLIPCNGGFLDWIRTYEASALCLDNILVSNNIHVNNFDSHSDWYGALSTDHYGISAEITLT